MDTWVKIGNEYFDANLINTQLSIGSHANLIVSINTIKNPESYNFFTNWFDSAFNVMGSRSGYASQYKKDISCKSFDAKGCFIKAIDFDPNTDNINLDISCDYLQTANISERREEKLDELLNETSKNKLI
jgi:hypothetical protein